MRPFTLGLRDIDKTKLHLAGGKGANLGELTQIKGIHVPDGFCITAETFKTVVAKAPLVRKLSGRLSLLKIEDREQVIALGSEIRGVIESIKIPADISEAIIKHIDTLGENNAYAIRSSATAEDLPAASFAGQQDTYLNITGKDAILKHISKCWASLFTERAIIYRIQNSFGHRNIQLAVVVQQMVFPQVSGVLFTADPVSSNRKVLSVDAGFGLGEAVVSGLVNADNYKVRDGSIIDKQIPAKKLALYAVKEGGTKEQALPPGMQTMQALTDDQVLQLENIGRKIEAYFGCPQDIEWCLADDTFYIVQSRPITTLYPIPHANDRENHVYVSVGHQQMMTDAMKPLGISVWQLTAGRPMYEAGGRMFVDITDMLVSPAKRAIITGVLGKSDPLIRDALLSLLDRGDFIQSLPADTQEQGSGKNDNNPSPAAYQALNNYEPSIVAELVKRSETAIHTLQQNIQMKSGLELFDFIGEDIQQLKKLSSDPQSFGVIMTAMNASSWMNEKMHEWLGEANVADTLSQSVPNNITSEMGLALLDVADVIRPYPEIIVYLQQVKNDRFLDELPALRGGQEAANAIHAFLKKYGMRCAGEIDITRPRWNERPSALIPVILSNICNVEPGTGKRKFEQGLNEALKKEQELLDRLALLPGGEEKAAEAKQKISLIRNLSGYREYPKYSIISRYYIYKQALLKEAARLVQASVIQEKEDIYYLRFEELRDVVRTQKLNYDIIRKRKEAYKLYEKLMPPRVFTSEGEIITGKYHREEIPANAIAGLAVSAGVAEGRARVILEMEDANLEEGDILVTTFTDPGWTPLFVSIKGLVTEVGGLMTHGAVIAREYGLPAVVGVENATKLIKDGQRIRVHGAGGYVEIL